MRGGSDLSHAGRVTMMCFAVEEPGKQEANPRDSADAEDSGAAAAK